MGEIKALTSLRGIVALWVMSYHLVGLSPVPFADPTGLTSIGYLGVDFFFVLSGFILAATYGRWFVGGFEARDYLRLLVRRVGRMFPLHVTVILICVAVAWAAGGPYSPVQVVEELTLVHRWPGVQALFRSINGPAWSISSEWLANILFPQFAALTLVTGSRVAVLVGCLAASSLAALVAFHSGSLDLSLANTSAPTIRCFTEFAIGMLLYRWHTIRAPRWAPLAALVTSVVVSATFRQPAALVPAMVAAIYLVGANRAAADRFLGGGIPYWLGEVSFSIYLVHIPIVTASTVLFPHNVVGYMGASIVATLAISAASYRWIEVPGRDWSRVLSDQMFRRVAVAE